MLTTNPKSALQKKLRDAQMACAHIRLLAELCSGDDDTTVRDAFGAGIAALADQIDSQIDDVHLVLSEAEPGVSNG
jgi:hypothetical protein